MSLFSLKLAMYLFSIKTSLFTIFFTSSSELNSSILTKKKSLLSFEKIQYEKGFDFHLSL